MKNICVIPARANSDRLPHKNRIKVNGVYNIELLGYYAKKTKLFKDIFCYTNDGHLQNNITGINVVERSEESSRPEKTFIDLLNSVIKWHGFAEELTNICILYPTALFINDFDISGSYSCLKNCDSVVSVTRVLSRYQNLLYKDAGVFVTYYIPDIAEENGCIYKEPYRHAGQFIWINVKSFMAQQKIVMLKTASWEMDCAVDIDTTADLNLARRLLPDRKISIES